MGEENDGPKAVEGYHPDGSKKVDFVGASRFADAVVRMQAPAIEDFRANLRAQIEEAKLEASVAAMRRLGVTKWNGIELGPAPAVPLPEVKARPPTKGEVHLQFWSKLRRSSGARIPACSAQCACGAWRMIDGQDGDLGD